VHDESNGRPHRVAIIEKSDECHRATTDNDCRDQVPGSHALDSERYHCRGGYEDYGESATLAVARL